MKFAAALVFAALLAQVTPKPTPAPIPTPTPSGPVYWGKPAVRMTVESRPLGFSPDGNARWLVVAHYWDANGRRTRVMAGGNVDWTSRDGFVQWQTRLRYGQPSAILYAAHSGVLTMNVHSTQPELPATTVRTDTRMWKAPRVVAKALGPYAVQIGWFPLVDKVVRIVRIDGTGARKTVAVIAGPSSSYRDTDVRPDRVYRYVLYRTGYAPVTLKALTLPAPPQTSVSNAAGKGMWLYFTTNPLDAIYFKHLNPQAIVAQAVQAHLHYIELRTGYGAFWEITP
jgi:hypothetical protein